MRNYIPCKKIKNALEVDFFNINITLSMIFNFNYHNNIQERVWYEKESKSYAIQVNELQISA